jgi:hypothetical protein
VNPARASFHTHATGQNLGAVVSCEDTQVLFCSHTSTLSLDMGEGEGGRGSPSRATELGPRSGVPPQLREQGTVSLHSTVYSAWGCAHGGVPPTCARKDLLSSASAHYQSAGVLLIALGKYW